MPVFFNDKGQIADYKWNMLFVKDFASAGHSACYSAARPLSKEFSEVGDSSNLVFDRACDCQNVDGARSLIE